MELAYACRPTQHRVLRGGSAFSSHLKSSLVAISQPVDRPIGLSTDDALLRDAKCPTLGPPLGSTFRSLAG